MLTVVRPTFSNAVRATAVTRLALSIDFLTRAMPSQPVIFVAMQKLAGVMKLLLPLTTLGM
jgi:predicted component of type VI protein secretion system